MAQIIVRTTGTLAPARLEMSQTLHVFGSDHAFEVIVRMSQTPKRYGNITVAQPYIRKISQNVIARRDEGYHIVMIRLSINSPGILA